MLELSLQSSFTTFCSRGTIVLSCNLRAWLNDNTLHDKHFNLQYINVSAHGYTMQHCWTNICVSALMLPKTSTWKYVNLSNLSRRWPSIMTDVVLRYCNIAVC